MTSLTHPKFTRNTKIYPEYTLDQIKKFQEMREEEEEAERNSLPRLDNAVERYSWVDERLEEMSSRVEEDDDEEKDAITFHNDNSSILDPLEDEESFYAWIDNRLEKMSMHVEEEDDEEKDNITFSLN